MPLEVPHEDLIRDFKGCVVMFKNKPVFIQDVARDGTVTMLDLLTQRSSYEPFTLKAFGAPIRRIGFVNTGNSVVYVCRNPVRRYFMGLSPHNVKIKTLGGINYPNGTAQAIRWVTNMQCPELGDAILDKYPTLEEACTIARKFKGACAFDKQFAVDANGNIWYRTLAVGECNVKTAQLLCDIDFGNNTHLKLLLDDNHEKTVRDFESKAA